MECPVGRKTEGSCTSAGGAIIKDGDVGVLGCGTGQNLALATAKIPGGDDRIDGIYSHCVEGIETAWVDRSWAAGNLGEHPAGDKQFVAKACKQVELTNPVKDDER
jgi:hypothetical protein